MRKATESLFRAEHCSTGEFIDATGDGGYTVWDSLTEAQDAIENEVASRPDEGWNVVAYTRIDTRLREAVKRWANTRAFQDDAPPSVWQESMSARDALMALAKELAR